MSAMFLRLWNWVSNLGRIRVAPEEIETTVTQGFYSASLALLQQIELAEYHDAMAAMLYHRRARLQKDPFNTRFFETADDDGFGPPPAPKKVEGGPTEPLKH